MLLIFEDPPVLLLVMATSYMLPLEGTIGSKDVETGVQELWCIERRCATDQTDGPNSAELMCAPVLVIQLPSANVCNVPGSML